VVAWSSCYKKGYAERIPVGGEREREEHLRQIEKDYRFLRIFLSFGHSVSNVFSHFFFPPLFSACHKQQGNTLEAIVSTVMLVCDYDRLMGITIT
jgi:hypothetical protein